MSQDPLAPTDKHVCKKHASSRLGCHNLLPLLPFHIRYGLATLAVVAAIALRLALHGLFGSGVAFITFYPAVILVAMFLGARAGIVATLLSALAVDYFLLPPRFHLSISSPGDVLALGLFTTAGILISWMAGLLDQLRRREAQAAEREHVQDQLLKAAAETARQKELLSVTLASIGDAVIVTDIQGRVTFLNSEAERLTGWTSPQAVGQPLPAVFNIVNAATREPVENPVDKVLRLGTVVALANHTILIAKDGREFPIDDSGAPIRQTDGSVVGVVLVFRDFTQRNREAEKLHRLNRTLKAFGRSSQTMIRAQSESQYLADVCDIIVKDCGHAMVWIGYADNDVAKSVRPVAHSGFAEGYLETLNISWADTERGRGPTGTAIRTGRPSMCQNMLTDPAFAPWRENAIQHGYASSIVLPLTHDGRVFGALTIYSRQLNVFSDDEVNLLTELANDLAYGISAIRLRAAHAEALEMLRQSEQRVRTKLDSILSPKSDLGALELGDIIDAPGLQRMLDNFHKLTHIPMAIIDTKGKVLVGIGWQDICTKFHRVNAVTCKHCVQSDTLLAGDAARGEFKLYKCKNNMWDMATPIMVGGRHVGNVFMGQFFFEGEDLPYDLFRSQARQYGFPEDEYLTALERVPRFNRQTVDTAVQFFLQLSQTISQLSYSNVQLARSLAERDSLTASLRDNEERLNRAQEKLQAANQTLEQRVAERTAFAEKRTEQLQALAAQLTQAEQKERQRLATILHDHLQQLLVGTKFHVGMLRGQGEFAQSRELIDQIDGLLDQSLETSRNLTVDLSPPILTHGNMTQVLQWLADWMRSKHGLEVKLRADERANPGSYEVRVLLFQATRELLFNIVKHARVDHATVELCRLDDRQRVRIVVRDSGAGFDSSKPRVHSKSGSGFGLFAIAERLDWLNGTFHIESTPGKGTCATLTAPLTAVNADVNRTVAAAGRDATHDTQPEDRGSSGKIRVLLADDHVVMRDGLARLLDRLPDMTVVGKAADGQEAVDMAVSLQPDVVITDVSMPTLDGLQAARLILAHCPHVKVIGLSMFNEDGMAESMKAAGATCYLAKTSGPDALIVAIRECASKSKS